jgi:hypothetical protein
MSSHDLLKYSFLWTIARLPIAAIALFIGGTPPVYMLFSSVGLGNLPLLQTGLTIAWIISGVASAYLLYMWHNHKMKLFGAHDAVDMGAFIIATVSGINLGIVGLIGKNIGMSIVDSNYAAFLIMGVLYLASAYHLYTKWDKHHQKLFN